jgi:Zn-dependent protease
VGTIAGVPVYVGRGWALIALVIVALVGPSTARDRPDLGILAYGVGVAYALLLLVAILVHEAAHALAARAFGLPVLRVVADLWGGHTAFAAGRSTAGATAVVAVVGPLANAALALGAWLLLQVTPGGIPSMLVGGFALLNAVLAAFNLLPGLPLDGGRVLSAAVWRATGRRHTGTVAAAWLGRGVAVLVLLLPFALAAGQAGRLDLVDVIWGALLGGFIWVGASQSLRQAGVLARLPGISARSLTRRAIPVPADLPLSEAIRRAHEAGATGLVVVSTGGDPVGLVVEAAVQATPVERRPWVPVGDLSRRLDEGHRLQADLSGEDLVNTMTGRPASEYLVVEANGDIYGVLATADVERALTRS